MTRPSIPLSIIDTWSPEQKLAVYDLCRLISETLWQHDRDGLLEAMIRDDNERGFDHVITNPPWHDERAIASPVKGKDTANRMADLTLDDLAQGFQLGNAVRGLFSVELI